MNIKHTLIPLCIIAFATMAFTIKKIGRTPQGKRMERILASPNYSDGKFQNIHPVPQDTNRNTKKRSKLRTMYRWMFRGDIEGVRPKTPIPAVKTDIRNISPDKDALVWFGHSSLFLQIDGIKILIDPVFSKSAAPVSFVNKAFKGTRIYKAKDIPEIDMLIITHDHWDHLDYSTVKALKSKVSKIICPLGVGEHFERWKFDMSQVIEMDWNDSTFCGSSVKIVCLPARHFSGRGFTSNQSLWASFLLKMPNMKIYLSGDGGYDTHFAEIGTRFGEIDLAILENGQYNENWKYIHMMPEQMLQAAKDLRAKIVMPVHNSKFAMGHHIWNDPLNRLSKAHNNNFTLITPIIGEVVSLRDSTFNFERWWEN